MAQPTGATLHHGCSFLLRSRFGPEVDWASLVKAIRAWISRRIQEENELGRAWFFTGGEWTSARTRRLSIRTCRAIGDGTNDVPQFWAAQFDHPCTEFQFRQWRTDAGFQAVANDAVMVSLETYHWILPSYVGEEPRTPVPSAPAVVSMLLDRSDICGYSGNEQIASTPFRLSVGGGKNLIRSLESTERLCPIVLLSCAPDSGEPRINPERLSRLLAGSAKVIVAESPSVDEELDYLIPRPYRCNGGMVRIFQPAVSFTSGTDFRRHRFFTRDRIDALGSDDVMTMIVRSASRRARLASAGVLSIDDVSEKQREARIRELRAIQPDASQSEWISALEEDNKSLTRKLGDAQRRQDELQLETFELQDALEERSEEVDSKERELRFVRSEIDGAHNEAAALENRVAALSALSELPATIAEMPQLLERLYAGRVFFTEKARRSAKEASFDDLGAAWKCLWSIPQVLWPLVFEEEARDLIGEYRNRSGFDLALTETGPTKQDKGLRSIRKDAFGGSEIDITPHIKIGTKPPRCLRVHFAILRDRKAIVVGHCGDHLETAGTRRRT